jgi:hypothetical protein
MVRMGPAMEPPWCRKMCDVWVEEQGMSKVLASALELHSRWRSPSFCRRSARVSRRSVGGLFNDCMPWMYLVFRDVFKCRVIHIHK